MSTDSISTRVVVQVRPKGAGPHHYATPTLAGDVAAIVEFDWATVQSISEWDSDEKEDVVSVTGWSIGFSATDDVAWRLVEGVIDAWFDAHDEENWLWEFRLVPLAMNN